MQRRTSRFFWGLRCHRGQRKYLLGANGPEVGFHQGARRSSAAIALRGAGRQRLFAGHGRRNPSLGLQNPGLRISPPVKESGTCPICRSHVLRGAFVDSIDAMWRLFPALIPLLPSRLTIDHWWAELFLRVLNARGMSLLHVPKMSRPSEMAISSKGRMAKGRLIHNKPVHCSPECNDLRWKAEIQA